LSAGKSQDFLIRNTLGLHARAAATLVKVTSRFACEVTAARGTTITITCEGADQDAALTAIGEVIFNKFGEE
jgi:phosphocarrier protein